MNARFDLEPVGETPAEQAIEGAMVEGDEMLEEMSPAELAVACCSDDADCGCHAHHGYISDKKRYLARLKRIEGQVRGVHRMIDEENYCIDILTQISALNSALKSVSLALLEDHMRHCVVSAAQSGGEELEVKLREAADAIRRLAK